MPDLAFPTTVASTLKGAQAVLLLVPEAQAKAGWISRTTDAPWTALAEKAVEGKSAGPSGRVIAFINPGDGPERIVIGLLPDRVSRHNAPARPESAATAAMAVDPTAQPTAVLACVEENEHALAVARAVVRAAPLYSRRTNGERGKPKKQRLAFLALDAKGKPVKLSVGDKAILEQARFAAMLVDMPTAELTTAAFEKLVRKAARGIPHLKVTAITGAKLLEKKLGGLHAVGRTAMVPPRLLLMEYKPPKAKRKIALVGKGIVYDTGGLSLKPSQGMAGMKRDMGGAAAVAGAVLALAQGKSKDTILGALALAENAIGPDAYRPDDILDMHSGKTVEINNTDAEGRLVLADAVSYVGRNYKPDVIVDAATLTGAQLVATGYRHAAIVSNRAGIEERAVEVGRRTGDLTHPLPFAPEFYPGRVQEQGGRHEELGRQPDERPVLVRGAVHLLPHPGSGHPVAPHRPRRTGVRVRSAVPDIGVALLAELATRTSQGRPGHVVFTPWRSIPPPRPWSVSSAKARTRICAASSCCFNRRKSRTSSRRWKARTIEPWPSAPSSGPDARRSCGRSARVTGRN